MFRTRPIPTVVRTLGSILFAVAAGAAVAHEAGDDWYEHERARSDGNPLGITHPEVSGATNTLSMARAPSQVVVRLPGATADCLVEEMKKSEGHVPSPCAEQRSSQMADQGSQLERRAEKVLLQ